MNKVFSIVWSHAMQAWVVASEKATRQGKGSGTRNKTIGVVVGSALGAMAHAAPPASNALPTNGQVVAGQVAMSQSSNTMNIHQSTQQGIVNWQSFNVGSDATVNFVQPNSDAATLNRVTSGGASQIFGNMNANGQVFVINPNGVLFGQSARVDVGGLVASSLGVSNDDFLAGNYDFSGDGSEGAVINEGELLGRYVAMLAPEVRNEGVVIAQQGAVTMAAGEAITLSIAGDQLIDVQVSKADFDTLVENRHLIQAEGGLVILSAQSASNLLGQTVNTGEVAAGGIVNDGGTVRLVASSEVAHSGTISVDGGQNGSGGSAILLASLDNPASRTDFSGSISAKGGTESGNGGFIETSAADVNVADTAVINTSAANGETGEWLIDPTDFTIGVNGDMSASALETSLGVSNVTIESVNGSEGVNGDIFVNDSLAWSTNQLTLSADRNIEINAPISVTAGGGLNLEFGQAGSVFDFPPTPGNYFVNAPVDLAVGTTFTTTYGNDGVIEDYTVITDEAGLLAVDSGMTGNYVLGSDISVATTPWAPLGNATGDFAFGTTGFTGIFDGLGHTIDGLTRGNTANSTGIGLFGQIGDQFSPGGLVQNLGVTNVDLAGLSEVGALAGANFGIVNNVYSTGTVTGGDVVGASNDNTVAGIGGLIGTNGGLIGSSYSSVDVTATTGDQSFGDGMDGGTGGLVGSNVAGSIDSSYATGSVTGNRDVGGLVGYVDGTVAGSYSTGAVSGITNAGGLVGAVLSPPSDPFLPPPPPQVFDSYWNTTTSGQLTSAGGGAGLTDAQARQQSNYTGFDFTNTWIMYEGISQPLLRSMLTPYFVTADDQSKTYDGNTFAGLTASESESPRPDVITGTLSYAGTGLTATNAGSYSVSVSGLDLTNAGKQDQQGFYIEYVDGTLTIDQAALSVTASGQSKTYGNTLSLDGAAFTSSGLVSGELIDSVTLTSATGIDASTTADAGTYADEIVGSGVTGSNGFNAANYDITYEAGDLTVDQRSITVTAGNQNKSYGDFLTLDTTAFTATNLVNGELIDAVTLASATGIDASTTADVGTYTDEIVGSDVTGSNGFDAANYDITYEAGDLTVGQRAITVSAGDQNKSYGDSLTLDTTAFTATNLVNGELIDAVTLASATGVDASTTADAGTYMDEIVGSGVTGSNGFDAANYDITYEAGDLTVGQRAITVTAGNQSKTYGDSLTLDSTAFIATNLVNGEQVNTVLFNSASGVDSDTSADAGTYADEIVGTGVTGSNGFSASNYDVTYVSGDLTVDQRAITVSAGDQSKTYGDNLTLDNTAFTATNLANGEAIDTVALASAGGIDSDTGANAGTYTGDIVASGVVGSNGFNAANYDINYQAADLTVDQATLTVRADDKVINDGANLPALTQTISGFVNGETLGTSDLSGSGEATTTAVDGGPTGNYVITSEQGTLASGNYTFDLVDGTLTIGVPTPPTPNPAPGTGTNTAVEIIQETLTRDTQGNGGSGGATSPGGGSFDVVVGTGSNGGAAPGSEIAAIQQGANQFCDNCVDASDVTTKDLGAGAKIAADGTQANEPTILIDQFFDAMETQVKWTKATSGARMLQSETVEEDRKTSKELEEPAKKAREVMKDFFQRLDLPLEERFKLGMLTDFRLKAQEEERSSQADVDEKQRAFNEAEKRAAESREAAERARKIAEADPDSIEKQLQAQLAVAQARQDQQNADKKNTELFKAQKDVALKKADLKKANADIESAKATFAAALLEKELTAAEQKEKELKQALKTAEEEAKKAQFMVAFTKLDVKNKEKLVADASPAFLDFSKLDEAQRSVEYVSKRLVEEAKKLEGLESTQAVLRAAQSDGHKIALLQQMEILSQMTDNAVPIPVPGLEKGFNGKRVRDIGIDTISWGQRLADLTVSEMESYLEAMKQSVKKVDPSILETHPTQVDYESAYSKWADAYKRDVSAFDGFVVTAKENIALTQQELVAARSNLEKVAAEVREAGHDVENYEEAAKKLADAKEALSGARSAAFMATFQVKAADKNAEDAREKAEAGLLAIEADLKKLRGQADAVREAERKAVEDAKLAGQQRRQENLEFFKDLSDGAQRYAEKTASELEKANETVRKTREQKSEAETIAAQTASALEAAREQARTSEQAAKESESEFQALDKRLNGYDDMLADLGPQQDATEEALKAAKVRLETAKHNLEKADPNVAEYIGGAADGIAGAGKLGAGIAAIGIGLREGNKEERIAEARRKYDEAVAAERKARVDANNKLNEFNRVTEERNAVAQARNEALVANNEAKVDAQNAKNAVGAAEQNAANAAKNVELFSNHLNKMTEYQVALKAENDEAQANAIESRNDYEAEKEIYS
jgi:filamentous hemagglutinin family protein